MRHAMPFECTEAVNDNDGFELIDTEMLESCGLFTSAKEAAEWATTYHIKCFHVYDGDGVLVMER